MGWNIVFPARLQRHVESVCNGFANRYYARRRGIGRQINLNNVRADVMDARGIYRGKSGCIGGIRGNFMRSRNCDGPRI